MEPTRMETAGSAYEALPPVLQFKRGTVEGRWSALYNGRVYDMWRGVDGWWRVKVDGSNIQDTDGTTSWGHKARATDTANRYARRTPPATGNGRQA